MLDKQKSMNMAQAQSIGKHEQNQTEYALDMYKYVVSVEKQDKNVVMSPASLATALAMTAAGAEGSTLDQFVAHLKHKDAQAMHQFYLYVKNVIFRDSSNLGGPVLGIANGLWVDEKTPFDSRFRKFVKAGYGAETQETDFRLRAGEVCKDVNDWVRMQTQGQSTNLLATAALYSYTRLLVVNALYFKGTWKEKFDAKMTSPKTFHLLNGGTVSVPMMSSSRKHYIKSYSNWVSQSDISLTFSFNSKEDPWSFEEPSKQVVVQVQMPAAATGAEDAEVRTNVVEPAKQSPLDFKVLKLPYKAAGSKDTRSFSMYIFLPDRQDGLPELEKGLDAAWLMRELPTMTRLEPVGDLRIPKFKVAYNLQANGALQSLGLTVPFSERRADFSGLLMDTAEARDLKQPTGCFCYGVGKAKRHFALSAVVHEAVVEVNEDGTEASTTVGTPTGLTRYNSLEPLYKVDFVADHPFLYVIREDSTGVLMFVGRVADPHDNDAPPLIDF